MGAKVLQSGDNSNQGQRQFPTVFTRRRGPAINSTIFHAYSCSDAAKSIIFMLIPLLMRQNHLSSTLIPVSADKFRYPPANSCPGAANFK